MTDKKISGFGYCSCNGHVDVDIFETEDHKYYIMIDFIKSSQFNNLTNELWKAVEEIEEIRKMMYS